MQTLWIVRTWDRFWCWCSRSRRTVWSTRVILSRWWSGRDHRRTVSCRRRGRARSTDRWRSVAGPCPEKRQQGNDSDVYTTRVCGQRLLQDGVGTLGKSTQTHTHAHTYTQESTAGRLICCLFNRVSRHGHFVGHTAAGRYDPE